MVARWLMIVKNNLLVIRMGVAGLTQWGSSWPRERVCGRGGIRKNCGKLWKSFRGWAKNRVLVAPSPCESSAQPRMAVPQKQKCRPKGAALEIGAERELQIALAATNTASLGGHLSKIRASRVEVHPAAAPSAPIGGVDEVERFGAELQSSLLPDGESFEQSEIPVLEPGLPDVVANASVIERAIAGHAKELVTIPVLCR